MKTLAEIRTTPVLLLTEEEIAQLKPDSQVWARQCQAAYVKQKACPGHEKVSTGTHEDTRHGWHPGHCKHCGMDMSVDSGG